MNKTRKATHRWMRLIALILMMALMLSACGSPKEDSVDPSETVTEDSTMESDTDTADGADGETIPDEDLELLQRVGLVAGEIFEITDADAQQISATVAGMRAAYVAGPGGEDPLVVERDWSAYSSSLGKENLSRREAEFYDALDKMALKYLRTSGLDGVRNTTHNVYTTDAVRFDEMGLTKEQAGAVYMWFRYNNPQYYFLSNYCLCTSVSWIPGMYETMADAEDRAKITNELFDKLDGWIRTVEDSAVTTYQKEFLANNLLCEKIVYQEEYIGNMNVDQSLYSSVMLESTVCAGYSLVFTAMMNALGVDATAGLSDTHAWNVVLFDDGNYYCVDVCWNDSGKAQPAYVNDYLNVGDATSKSRDNGKECHIYSDNLVAWIPAIAKDDYVPTSADTDPKPQVVDKTAVKTPQVKTAEVGGTVVKLALDNVDEKIVIRTYADAEHKTMLDGLSLSVETDYVVAGLDPNRTYYFAFAGRKTVDGETYYSDWVYLTVTTAADDSAVNIQYPEVAEIENIRVTDKQEDMVTIAWDSITDSDGANIYYTVYLFTDSTYAELENVFWCGSKTTFDLIGLTPGETYYFSIKALRVGGGMTVYSDWMDYEYTFTAPETNNYVTVEYSTGVYFGEIENNQPNGYGKMTWADGGVYEGEWKDSKYNGYGKCTYVDGSVYYGEWQDGIYNGYGNYTYANGAVYDGEWKDGVPDGHGAYIFMNGDVYDGEWKNGVQDGHGVYTWVSGKSKEGDWENGELIGWSDEQ